MGLELWGFCKDPCAPILCLSQLMLQLVLGWDPSLERAIFWILNGRGSVVKRTSSGVAHGGGRLAKDGVVGRGRGGGTESPRPESSRVTGRAAAVAGPVMLSIWASMWLSRAINSATIASAGAPEEDDSAMEVRAEAGGGGFTEATVERWEGSKAEEGRCCWLWAGRI